MVAVALALALPGAAHANPAASSVARTVDIGAQGASVTLRCPGGAVSLAAAVTGISPESTTRASEPEGVGAWSFRFAGGPGRARVVLRCARVTPSGTLRRAAIRVASRTLEGTVPAHGALGATVRCPEGYVPTGYGLEQDDSGTAVVSTARPGSRGWRFVLENEGNRGTRPILHIRCLGRVATASGPRGNASQRLVVQIAGWRDTVGGGARRRITHRCPAGHFSAGAGHSLLARDDIVASRAYTFRTRPGRWLFTNPGGGAQTARTFLTCLSLRTGFG